MTSAQAYRGRHSAPEPDHTVVPDEPAAAPAGDPATATAEDAAGAVLRPPRPRAGLAPVLIGPPPGPAPEPEVESTLRPAGTAVDAAAGTAVDAAPVSRPPKPRVGIGPVLIGPPPGGAPEPGVEPNGEPDVEPVVEPDIEPAPVLAAAEPMTQAAEPTPAAAPATEWIAVPPPVPVFEPQPEPEPMPTVTVLGPPAPQLTVPLAPDMAQLPPQPPAPWDLPSGFVPFQAPRRGSGGALKWVALGLVVAVLGAVVWLGYSVLSNHTSPTAGPATPIAAAAVQFSSPEGHFTVGLPAEPQTLTGRMQTSGFTMDYLMAEDEADKQVVFSFTITPAVPADRIVAAMHGGINGFSKDSTLSDVQDGMYQGHPSVTAVVDDHSGTPAHLMIFEDTPARFYLLAAADDATLSALESRFQPAP